MPVTINGTTGLSATAAQFLVGQVCFFAMNSAPSGFLTCAGQAVSRTTYSALFTAIGTTYGSGDGSTTFNLPDLRGEFVRGMDNGRGIDSGRVFGSSQTDALQGHKHSIDDPGFNPPGVSNGALNAGATGFYQRGVDTIRVTSPITDGSNGTPRTAAETRPRNVALLSCIFTGV
jgi:phage-related tail fiber protein